MKAFLLAAGLGTRLRPLTYTVPKCLLLVRNKPLLAWWAELLLHHGITEVLVNTHYLPEQVSAFIDAYNAQETGLMLHAYHEDELLGSGGTVLSNEHFLGKDEDFFICYADSLTDIDLSTMFAFHKLHTGVLTMALFQTDKPEECGIAEIDDDSRIIDFVEKPDHPKSGLANAGVYIANRGLFKSTFGEGFLDFGQDVLPALVGNMYGYEVSDYLIDIGTFD
ncbi:MAG: nucleotidyltransferase family protein, partial [Clostridiales Family XIII bacterium]|nr:nucleotidyltransferase family protein [Clostridiales Family XIII bacterium]